MEKGGKENTEEENLYTYHSARYLYDDNLVTEKFKVKLRIDQYIPVALTIQTHEKKVS